jgi:hypothetical protein
MVYLLRLRGDPRALDEIGLDTSRVATVIFRRQMTSPKKPEKRPRGRPAVVRPVREMRIGLTEALDVRFQRYRAFFEARSPGVIASDSGLGRNLLIMGLDAFEKANPPQTELPLEASTTKSK